MAVQEANVEPTVVDCWAPALRQSVVVEVPGEVEVVSCSVAVYLEVVAEQYRGCRVGSDTERLTGVPGAAARTAKVAAVHGVRVARLVVLPAGAEEYLPVLHVGRDHIGIAPIRARPARHLVGETAVVDHTERQRFVVVLGVAQDGGAQLTDVAEAGRLPCLLARLGEHWEEDCRQDRDNGDHHQQLNERETLTSHTSSPPN